MRRWHLDCAGSVWLQSREAGRSVKSSFTGFSSRVRDADNYLNLIATFRRNRMQRWRGKYRPEFFIAFSFHVNYNSFHGNYYGEYPAVTSTGEPPWVLAQTRL